MSEHSAPAIVIRLQLEAPPILIAEWTTDADGARLRDWLDARPAYYELLSRALELRREAQAA